MIEGASAAIQTSAEVQALIDAVIGEATAAKRKAAAKELKERAEKSELIPTFATLCADLELAKNCSAKKKIIAAIEAEGAARALPALERLAEAPKLRLPQDG